MSAFSHLTDYPNYAPSPALITASRVSNSHSVSLTTAFCLAIVKQILKRRYLLHETVTTNARIHTHTHTPPHWVTQSRAVAGMGWWLDWMILLVFPTLTFLWVYDSHILKSSIFFSPVHQNFLSWSSAEDCSTWWYSPYLVHLGLAPSVPFVIKGALKVRFMFTTIDTYFWTTLWSAHFLPLTVLEAASVQTQLHEVRWV